MGELWRCGDMAEISDLVKEESRRTKLAIDFSTSWTYVSYANGVLGACVMITLALLRTERLNAGERNHTFISSRRSYRWEFLAVLAVLALHDGLSSLPNGRDS